MSTIEPGVTGRRAVGASRRKRHRTKVRGPPEVPKTITVPEAGKQYFGLSRNASYEAAARGDIPTVRIGKLLRVPVRAMERLLDEAGRLPAAE